ncbi:MAG: valine--tRNA ligase [Candidatus Brennerbacteria bacterium]|nr:valine--tRNA ligase [Candidatus Brennerbacteria bacterium]
MENLSSFEKPYNSKEIESKIYQIWEKSGYFNPDNLPATKNPEAKSFCIMMPPPNVTGTLHMGHALGMTLEDIMIRYHRMKGDKTLWLPGTDHAAIATQAKVEKEIYKKENKTRYDLGREEFLKRVEEFAKTSHDAIIGQIKAMGASCDFSREAFTLDEKRSLAVRTMFKKMHDDGLIYRGNRIVNWDPKGGTTISDDEIVYEERETKLYTFRYSKDFPIPIATTRPETKLGDTAVAVNPKDKRYKNYINKEYDADFAGAKLHIKIIADEAIDPAFGTGAVGVTPAHSVIDSEIAQKHGLPMIQVIDERARITAGKFAGKKINEARELIVNELKENGLLEKEEIIIHNIATAERTGGVIEPLPKLQWFVKTAPLKDLMRKPVETGQIKIIPDYFTKTYFHWVDNLRDWCISRQIWYGHRIPVWYHESKCVPIPGRENETSQCEEISVGEEKNNCGHCGAKFIQDEDTLDTWFSSALWTFSTLGWPSENEQLKIYHPTDVLETGYEILFFWVARMVMMAGYALGQIPFRSVYLHGTVRDSQGRKMSKSLGNIIDPLDIAGKYGTDAMRMALISGAGPGTDMKISEEKIKGYKNFANKIWNIARFVLENSKNAEGDVSEKKDKELLKEFEELKNNITTDIEEFRFSQAGEKIYHYIWHRFADIIIEESKPVLKENRTAKTSKQILLQKILMGSIKLLHPFMPFITEEIYQQLPIADKKLLMIEKW